MCERSTQRGVGRPHQRSRTEWTARSLQVCDACCAMKHVGFEEIEMRHVKTSGYSRLLPFSCGYHPNEAGRFANCRGFVHHFAQARRKHIHMSNTVRVSVLSLHRMFHLLRSQRSLMLCSRLSCSCVSERCRIVFSDGVHDKTSASSLCVSPRSTVAVDDTVT